ncbi:MAG: hypothetical protein AMXMBFR84_16200 [Candidatus Hydrogenedentota bacterium]
MRGVSGFLCLLFGAGLAAMAAPINLSVLPAEHKHEVDPVTGAELTYLTTNPARDVNLYFHERSWLADGSMILFVSQREHGGLMGYLTATGELVALQNANGALGGATAANVGPRFYAQQGNDILEITLSIQISPNAPPEASRVTAIDRTIATLPPGSGHCSLNENATGEWISVGMTTPGDGGLPAIYIINIASGIVRELCRVPKSPGYQHHVQWSRTNPYLLSFAGDNQRLQVVDIRDGIIHNVYKAIENELVTHESWWVDDQIIFCGGVNPKPTEDSHVKVLNIYNGQVRIAGAGAWWPAATPETITRLNWWHAAGSADGRWIIADNWHGDLMLFEGQTTRPKLLTKDHRTYGKGDHPHVGWDRTGRQAVFTSHRLGNPDVCVATIPEQWQADNSTPTVTSAYDAQIRK